MREVVVAKREAVSKPIQKGQMFLWYYCAKAICAFRYFGIGQYARRDRNAIAHKRCHSTKLQPSGGIFSPIKEIQHRFFMISAQVYNRESGRSLIEQQVDDGITVVAAIDIISQINDPAPIDIPNIVTEDHFKHAFEQVHATMDVTNRINPIAVRQSSIRQGYTPCRGSSREKGSKCRQHKSVTSSLSQISIAGQIGPYWTCLGHGPRRSNRRRRGLEEGLIPQNEGEQEPDAVMLHIGSRPKLGDDSGHLARLQAAGSCDRRWAEPVFNQR